MISDDDAYNDALERVWRDWFSAPTHLPNVSGAAWLRGGIHGFWKSGAILAQLITDPNAEGPVKLRVRPTHPRRLASPADRAGDPNVFMGIRFDGIGRPTQYYIHNPIADVRGGLDPVNDYETVPPDLIIHEFLRQENDQAREIPWLATALSTAADLRDYDDQVQDAARQMADQCGYFFTEHPDAAVWDVPETDTVERRTYKMAPPGWKPYTSPPGQPPVQYPEYRAEKHRDLGRPVGMPLLIVRMDASGHNYSSARFDSQGYSRAVAGLQQWLSGDEQNTGMLNRLVDEVVREARFLPELRNRPAKVSYKWTWPVRPHVDPLKSAMAVLKGLQSGAGTITEALAAEGKSLESHIETLKRERESYVKAELPLPAHLRPEPEPGAKTKATGFQQPAGATK